MISQNFLQYLFDLYNFNKTCTFIKCMQKFKNEHVLIDLSRYDLNPKGTHEKI